MARRSHFFHLNGQSAYYPFAARTHLRRRQRRHSLLLWGSGLLLLLVAGGLLARQLLFRGGQPDSPLSNSPAFSASGNAHTEVTEQNISILPQYRQLYAENHDLVGWLCVPGTAIDYPVLQTPSENEYYLHRSFDGHYAPSGSLFLDAACTISPKRTANWMIYGHNMADGSMFADLLLYREEDFCKEHPTFRFDTLYREGSWQVVAVLETAIGESDHPYYAFFDATDEEDWNRWFDSLHEQTLYETGVPVQYGQQLLTLSTCSQSLLDDGHRFAVLAVAAEG